MLIYRWPFDGDHRLYDHVIIVYLDASVDVVVVKGAEVASGLFLRT